MQDRLEVMRGVIHPWHLDHFGHMNVRHYAPFFDDAVYHLWTKLGLGYPQMQRDFWLHTVTARATTSFIRELRAGDLIVIDGALAHLGTKSCSFHLRMCNAETRAVHATCDVVEVFFDPSTRRAAPMPDALRSTLAALPVQA